MQTYPSHLVYFRSQPWATLVEPDANVVWTFIKEYCRNNNMPLNADEWVVIPHQSLIGKSIMDGLRQATNPMNVSARLPNYMAQEGNIRVKPHIRGYD